MKYETLTEFKSDVTLATGATSTFTFTYTNNINHLPCIFLKDTGANSTYRNDYFVEMTSVSFTNNILTIIVTNKWSGTVIYDLFLLVTAASY